MSDASPSSEFSSRGTLDAPNKELFYFTMKLHLPITLFTALMAVMTTLQSQAKYTLNIGGEDVDVTQWSGELTTEDSHISPYVYKDKGSNYSYLQKGSNGDFLPLQLRIEKKDEEDTQTLVRFYCTKQSPNSSFYILAPLEDPSKIYIGEGCTFEFAGNGCHLAVGVEQHARHDGAAEIDVYGTLRSIPNNKENSFYSSGKIFMADNTGYTATGKITIHKGGVLDGGGSVLWKREPTQGKAHRTAPHAPRMGWV